MGGLVIVITYFVFWTFLNIEVRTANDFPFTSMSSVTDNWDLPRVWSPDSSSFGEYVVSTLWSWPMDLLYGLGGKLGMPFPILMRLLGIFPIIVFGIMGISRLLKHYGVGRFGIFAGTLLYLVNTYILLVVDGGQLAIGLSYIWLPVSYLAILKGVDGGWTRKLIAGLAVSVLGFFDPRFIFVLLILLSIHFIFHLFLKEKKALLVWVFEWIKTGVVTIIVYAGLNFYWLLPAVLAKHPTLPEGYSGVSQTSFLNFTTWKHALLLLQPHWYLNVFGKVAPIRWEFLLIPVLAFLVPTIVFVQWILRKILSLRSRMTKEILRPFSPQNDNKGIVKNVMFWTIVAVVGIFLTKGANPPFGEVYNFLFTNVPGFSLFRDSTKFFFLVALSYSILIGYSVDHISIFLSKIKIQNRSLKSYILNPKSFLILLTSYFIILAAPVYTCRMTGMFSKPVYEKESFAVADVIEKDIGFSRVFYIPSRAPLGYSSPTHPSVEALRLLSLRPFAIGVVGNYEKFNYLREAPFMGELFAVAGIKYIYYPYPDTRRETLKQDNIDYYYAFLDQLTNLPWIEKKISDPPVSVLQTKKTKEHIFLAENSYYVVGSDRIYNDLMQIPGFDLSNNALIFVEEEPGVINDIDPTSRVILYDKDETDLMMSFVGKENFYFPASNIEREPSDNIKKNTGFWTSQNDEKGGDYIASLQNDKGGLWKRETADFMWWRNFLQTKYGLDYQEFDYNGGWVIAEGDLRLTIDDLRFTKGNNLFVRAMTSTKGGRIEIFQGKKKIGEIDTFDEEPEKMDIKLTGYGDIPDKISTYDKVDFRWFNVGRLLQDNEPLEIKMYGDLNVINVISTVTEEEWNLASKLFDQIEIVDWKELPDEEKVSLLQKYDTANVSYKRIDPTKYEVEITGLTEPAYLIFSETFDELWELNGQPAKRVYSFVNGFYVDKDGRYTLFFTPQKYVPLGLIVSGFSLISILGILLILKRKK